MRELLETLYSARVVAWAEPTDDGERYEVVVAGRRIVADTPHLLLRAVVADAVRSTRPPLRLAA